MIPIILSAKPARIISGIENLFAPKTIAFGGVATGSIKAQLAARQTGTVRETGRTPMPTATAPNTGRKVEVVATLLVTSVKKIINAATANIKNIGGTALNTLKP